jgi:hypothetical protein
MAMFEGISLAEVGAPSAGGAFYLHRPSPISDVISVDAGWSVEVKQGCPVVVARGHITSSYDDARAQAASTVERGLDILSIQSVANLVVNDLETRHFVWWVDGSTPVLRIASSVDHFINTDIELSDVAADGTITRRTPPPHPAWRESFRYFRLSQVTNDLFDAYRNLYLALESLLSFIAPQRVRNTGEAAESERTWFLRALTEANKHVPLTRFAPPGATDPGQALGREFYTDKRTAVFHAKAGRPVLLPRAASLSTGGVDEGAADTLAHFALRRQQEPTALRCTNLGQRSAERPITARRRMQTDDCDISIVLRRGLPMAELS